ncbi:hypothetical protein [Saccharopolyspora phatthalungensis]|uniref:Uncharacterized protein n=1 Tax=Saccharopolyspora phatthalungensis TaxID=664693 RepID=A0A840PZT3_9PSEU|nr:hypothetical protein [Saccharopolyspora phatthalungensis]MBB5153544.1 hypothetical protein [Saccharopolyspora phatthalungensis]
MTDPAPRVEPEPGLPARVTVYEAGPRSETDIIPSNVKIEPCRQRYRALAATPLWLSRISCVRAPFIVAAALAAAGLGATEPHPEEASRA